MRLGYQVAVSLWIYEGSLIWSKFPAMIYANTIVLATIGLLMTGKPEVKILRFALAVLGILLCLAWFWIIKRSFDYHNYWVYSARELEMLYIQPVETVTRVRSLARGDIVTFQAPVVTFQEPEKLTYQRRGLAPKIESVAYLVITVFTIIYLITLTQ